MSTELGVSPPKVHSPARANAKETLWRLMALALAHPTPEFYETLADGRFREAFDAAWHQVQGRRWLPQGATSDYATFESGYIHMFMHGFKGRPVAPILAGEYESVLAGLSRPVLMLNLSTFYKHFGLQAATHDEGRLDEPDHLAVMAEFMAVLCHLEARALSLRHDASPYRRAQRDFLGRYLKLFLEAVNQRMQREDHTQLDACLWQMMIDMGAWADQLLAELEALVGAFRPPSVFKTSQEEVPLTDLAAQNLWG